MATKMQVRRDTAANWTSANPTLSNGEMGYETDTSKMKIGDGTTAWASLGYFVDADDADTTYTISTAQSGSDADVTLTGSDSSTDTVTLVAGTNLSLTVAGDNITVAVDNDLSNYDNTTTAFISDITGENIGDLSDVDVSSLSSGHVLAYDGANWVAGAPAVLAANDLSDVTITSVTSNDILQWTGSAFVNLAPGDLTGFATVATSGDYDDLTNKPTSFAGTFDGDLTGSIYGDDSTLLVDGVNNKIPSANLEGALPALDGSNLTGVTAGAAAWGDITGTPTTLSGYGITDAISEVSNDTSPQLGGNLDLNSNNITGTGNLTLTSGNATISSGDLSVTGDVIISGANNDLRLQNAGVSGTGQTIANFKAEVSGTEYNTVQFKSGPDNFADNGEVTWSTRIQGSLTEVFEIKGSTTGRSGMVINPQNSADIDTIIAGGSDAFLLTVNASNDKVGIGKDPTQGLLDVDGAIYASTFGGNIQLSGNTIDVDDSSNIAVLCTLYSKMDFIAQNDIICDNKVTADEFRGTIVATAGTAPTVATDPGQTGEMRFDDNYIYIKTSAGWKRAALSGLV